MKSKYKVIKGDDGKYRLTRGDKDDKPMTKASMSDALKDRIKKEKGEC